MSFSSQSPSLSPSSWQNWPDFCLYSFAFYRKSYKWNHTIYNFICMISFLSVMLSRFFHDIVCNSIYINVNKHILCWTDLILLTSSVLINSSWVLTTVYRGVVCSFLLLNDISLYQRSTFCLSVHQSEDIWVVSILDYYKQCCFEQHTHTGVCVDISCHFFWF